MYNRPNVVDKLESEQRFSLRGLGALEKCLRRMLAVDPAKCAMPQELVVAQEWFVKKGGNMKETVRDYILSVP